MTNGTQRLLKRTGTAIKRFFSPVGDRFIDYAVNITAALALILLIVTTIIGSMEPAPFTLEPKDRPFLYDLSLAILGAWIFQQLLISLPARRKLKQYFKVFRPQLFTIAESGGQLLRDFEFISRSPHQVPATEEHISKVLMATNINPATTTLLESKMADTWNAIEDLANVSQYLSEDIQHAVQVLRQNPLVRNAVSTHDWTITLKEARVEERHPWDPHLDKPEDYIRETWHSHQREFIEYYEATRVIAKEVANSRMTLKPTDRRWRNTPTLTYLVWERDAENAGKDSEGEPYPVTEYPPTALNYKSLEVLTANPGPTPLPTAEERIAQNEADEAEEQAVGEHFEHSRRMRESREPNA
ncbi:hypothetical protein [Arthrobacter sp. SLBN-122]|uniref:hypothetical protein n=1 Tax=Arthrobacter sp. SLBN-122 TaxID=2768455 RepID=UPI001150F058|nr:hypothetical protein [Arthrobacter sp. SLBN-122]TQJ35770.1 hypothetical protein FBY36_3049 [Arthrobacter sp. SLBN-122]